MTAVNQKLLIGYFPSAVIHGQRYQVADIPGDKLTHVIYAYVGVSSSNQCESINPQDDQLNFAALQLLKQNYRGLQILVSIGGPSNSGNYSDTASTTAKRKTFAQSCIIFMKQSGFDGIDIDWEFPAAQDKLNYTALLNELRNELDTQGATDNKHYLLTAAISGKVDLYSNVDLTQIQQSLDWINLMTYNFYDSSNTITEFCAPLYLSSTDPQPDQLKRTWYNVTAAVDAFESASVPTSKIVIGVPFFGQGWEGVPNTNHGLYQTATGPAQGTWQKDGVFDFDDLQNNYVGSYLRFWNAEVSAPWLYNPDTGIMISYDDTQSLGLKASYINDNNLAGVMIWQLAADDSQQSLINALYNGLYPTTATAPAAFTGTLPYASELYGIYQPLIGWVGNQAVGRVSGEDGRNMSAAVKTSTNMPWKPRPLVVSISGLNFSDPIISSLVNAAGGNSEKNSAVLSPVGLIDLFREYFFQLDTFLGQPVGHVWLSPGGTITLIEVSTKKTTIEQTTEMSTETSRSTQEGLTQQDDLADAVKQDNLNNTKLGVSANVGGTVGVYHASASASFNSDNTTHTAQEESHKQTRTQSTKESSEIRRNFKSTFRTVTEDTDTTSRQYVIQSSN